MVDGKGNLVKDLGAAKPDKGQGPSDADIRAANSEVKTHFKTYSDTQTQANHILGALDMSQNGNQVASALAPLESTLFITSSAGVRRVNEVELNMNAPGAGGAVRRINAWFDNNATGTLPLDYVKDLRAVVSSYKAENEQSYKDKVDSVNERYGTRIKYGTLPNRTQNPAGDAKADAAKIHANMADFARQYTGKNGTIYSDDGRTWYDQNGARVGGK